MVLHTLDDALSPWPYGAGVAVDLIARSLPRDASSVHEIGLGPSL